MKSLLKITIFVILMSLVTSCKSDLQPNYQYMPNMYVPVGYEAYGEYNVFQDGQSALLPPLGAIPRGWQPYAYVNTNEDYLKAKEELKNPLLYTQENVDNGKVLYDIYCAICHGTKGDGQGNLAKREKILGIPAYNDQGRAITEGSIYHVMYYGKNNMGSYANQVNEKERWQIDHYVIDLKRKLDGLPQREFQTKDEMEMHDDVATSTELESATELSDH